MFKNIDLAIQLASLIAEIAVIGLLFYRRVWRTLPVFFSYCVWDISSNLVLVGIQHYAPRVSFHALFVDVVIDSALMFCVLVELAWSVLRPIRPSLPRSSFFLIGLLILVAAAIIWPFAGLQNLSQATTREGFLYAQLQQTASILRILFFLILAGGSQLLSIGWRDRELQVATGFGLYSMVSLTVAVIQTHLTDVSRYNSLFLASGAAYLGCLLYWGYSFAHQEAARREFTPQMQRFLLAVAGAARSTRVGLEETHGVNPREPK